MLHTNGQKLCKSDWRWYIQQDNKILKKIEITKIDKNCINSDQKYGKLKYDYEHHAYNKNNAVYVNIRTLPP